MPKSPPTVFISYAREDLKDALKLYNDLKRAGTDPWLDKKKLLPGQRWKVEIKRAIRESHYFLAVLSSNSVSRRGYVHKEVAEALEILDEFPESEIFMIPVRLDDCSPSHERLRDLQWVDMFPSWGDGFEKILRAIGVQPRDNGIHWAMFGIIVAVIVGLIVLGAWLVPNARDSLVAWLFETPTVTPIGSPTHTSVISTATPVPLANTPTTTNTPSPTAIPTSTATDTPSPTAIPTSTATDTPSPPTPTLVPTVVPQPALTIYLRDTRTEMGFAVLSGDKVNGGEIYEEGKCVYGDAAVQIGETIYHFDKPEVEPKQLPDPWRVEFEFAEELEGHTRNEANCTETGAGFDPKKAWFWVGTLDGGSAVGEGNPYSLTMKLHEGNVLRKSIQVFFTVGDVPGVPDGDGPPDKPPPSP